MEGTTDPTFGIYVRDVFALNSHVSDDFWASSLPCGQGPLGQDTCVGLSLG